MASEGAVALALMSFGRRAAGEPPLDWDLEAMVMVQVVDMYDLEGI